MYLAAP
jgi:hypothetical protein